MNLNKAIYIAVFLAAMSLIAHWFLWTEALECGTDTECMEMHGGNGDPE